MRTRLKYSEEFKRDAISLAEKGYMDKEIIECLGVSESTFYTWKRKHPDFEEELIKAKYKVNKELEAVLYKKSVGYEVTEQKITANVGKTGEKISKVEKSTKHIEGDSKLLLILLKNRMPEKYRDSDRQQIQIEGNMTQTINLKNMSDDELLEAINKLENNGTKTD